MCKNPKYRLDSLRSTQLTFINVMNVHYINYDIQDTCTCRRLPWRRSLFIMTYSFLCRCKLNRFVVSCLGPFAFLLPTIFELFGFPIVWLCAYLMKVIPETYLMKVIPETYLMKVIPETCSERTWWRLFLKHVVSVPDEGYSWNVSCERTWWRLFLKPVMSVPDEGYSWNVMWAYLMKVIPETYLMKVIPETCCERTWWRLFPETCCKRTWWRLFLKRTWWRLFLKQVVSVPDEGYSWNMLWAYLMKIIPETCPVQ